MVGCEKVTVAICVSLRTKPVTPGSSIWLHIFWTFDSPAGPRLGSQKIPTKSVYFSYREKLIEQMKHHSIKWLSKHSPTFFGQRAGALGKWECLYIYGTWQSERLAVNADIYLPHQTFTDEMQQRIYRESIWISRSSLPNVFPTLYQLPLYVSCCSSEGARIG